MVGIGGSMEVGWRCGDGWAAFRIRLRRTGFYTLRRTAVTVAARPGDPFAVQRVLGHADLQMATRYVQDVSEQTDRVIENSRKYVI